MCCNTSYLSLMSVQHLTFCDSTPPRRHLSSSGCGRLHTTAEEEERRSKEGIYQHSRLFRAHSRRWDREESLSPFSSVRMPQWWWHRQRHKSPLLKIPLCCLNTFPCGTCVLLPDCLLLLFHFSHLLCCKLTSHST